MTVARGAQRLGMLAELAEIGMKLAREVGRQALGEALPAAEPDAEKPDGMAGRIGGHQANPATNLGGADLGLAFARIARAVRQTLALEARLEAEETAREAQITASHASRAGAERKRVKQQKNRVRGFVEEAITDAADGSERENLLLDLDERLEDPDIEDELGSRPIGVIVAGICDDLGVKVDLRGFTDAELGFDETSMRPAGKPGADVGLASMGADPDSGLGTNLTPDPGGVADTNDPPTSLPASTWPPGLAHGRDPP